MLDRLFDLNKIHTRITSFSSKLKKEYFNYLLKKQTGILENIPKYKIITRMKMRKKVFFLKRLGNTNV